MFKELIEKLEDSKSTFLGSMVFVYNGAISGIDKAIDIVEEYQKEKYKPFDPELVGFKKLDNTNFVLKTERVNLRKEIDIFITGIGSYVITEKDYVLNDISPETPYHDYRYLGRIPNHAFGVELLKNLGVIE